MIFFFRSIDRRIRLHGVITIQKTKLNSDIDYSTNIYLSTILPWTGTIERFRCARPISRYRLHKKNIYIQHVRTVFINASEENKNVNDLLKLLNSGDPTASKLNTSITKSGLMRSIFVLYSVYTETRRSQKETRVCRS